MARWHAAHLRLAELGLRATGAPDPRADAPLIVATITGFMLGQLVTPVPTTSRSASSGPRSSACSPSSIEPGRVPA